MEIIFALDGIEDAANEFIEYTRGYRVVAFSGELGAGKTTFINAVCRQLGVKEAVTSPTYAIIQEYYFEKENIIYFLYHIDMYRIRDIDEAIDAGVEDCLLSDRVCLVEWPEKAILLFPGETVYVSIESVSATTRKLIAQLPQ